MPVRHRERRQLRGDHLQVEQALPPSNAALAEATDRSYGFVHRMLSESGVVLRGRDGAIRTKTKAS